jgi:TRAP-type mannitol/chloroaromatic compound transport system permease small subunit
MPGAFVAVAVFAERGLTFRRPRHLCFQFCLVEFTGESNRWHSSRQLHPASGSGLRFWLRVSGAIDWINEKLGALANVLVLLSCLVSAGNAMMRYAYDVSSNGWLEAQWYMFAVMVMFGASYTLRRNEHVRVEIFYLYLTERGQLWLDLFGAIVFLMPVCLLLAALSWPFFAQSYAVDEFSGNAGGLPRWPVKFVLPAGFALIALQGLSEIIKRIAALKGYVMIDARYERPMQ